MFNILRNSIEDFKLSYKCFLLFELLFLALASFAFVPMFSFIFNQIIKMNGADMLINAEVYQAGLTYSGAFGMLLIGIIAVILLFFELGVLLIIAQKNYFQQRVFVVEAIITAVRKLPKLLGIGIFFLVPLVLLLSPFIDIPGLPALIDFNLPIYVTAEYYQSTISVIGYGACFLLAMYLFIRCLFTLHYIFIYDYSVFQAIKSSVQLTKQNKWKLIFNLCLLNGLVSGIGLILLTFIPYLAEIIESNAIVSMIEQYLITFTGYIAVILTLLILPVNMLMITRSFYTFTKPNSPEDRLAVKSSKKWITAEKRILLYMSRKKYMVASIVVFYLTVLFGVNYYLNDRFVYLDWNVSIASHRGDFLNAPENSMSSIRSALDKGVDAIEIDVTMTKDGIVILNHDLDLQRTAGIPKRIADMTYAEIAQIDIGHLDTDTFIGEKMPTLNEVLEEIKKENVQLIIDIKPPDERIELAVKTVELVEMHNMEESAYIQSFDYQVLQEIRKKNADIKIGQILFLAAGDLSNLDVDFYTIRQSMLTERFVKRAKEQNREVWVWTVNSERNMKEVLKYRIDGIITDYPERARGIIGIDFAQ